MYLRVIVQPADLCFQSSSPPPHQRHGTRSSQGHKPFDQLEFLSRGVVGIIRQAVRRDRTRKLQCRGLNNYQHCGPHIPNSTTVSCTSSRSQTYFCTYLYLVRPIFVCLHRVRLFVSFRACNSGTPITK